MTVISDYKNEMIYVWEGKHDYFEMSAMLDMLGVKVDDKTFGNVFNYQTPTDVRALMARGGAYTAHLIVYNPLVSDYQLITVTHEELEDGIERIINP